MLLAIAKMSITLLVGLSGGLLAKKLRAPAPFMTGSMLAVLIFGLLTRQALFPASVKPLIQAVAGAAIGVGFHRAAASELKKIILPSVVYVLCLIAVPSAATAVMVCFTGVSPVTALLSCAPGGIVDMSLLSYEFGANTPQVAVLQAMRLIVALGIFPSLTRLYLSRFGKTSPSHIEREQVREEKPGSTFMRNMLPTMLVLSVSGLIGFICALPAGALTCSMLAVAAFQIKTGRAHMPLRMKQAAQVAAGAMVGTGITIEDLKKFPALFIPFLIVLSECLILNFIIGPFIAKLFKLDLTTLLLACTPAGVSDMALIAGGMGGNPIQVAVFQLVRLTSVLIYIPFLAGFLTNLLNYS